jgi:hypothetical protein
MAGVDGACQKASSTVGGFGGAESVLGHAGAADSAGCVPSGAASADSTAGSASGTGDAVVSIAFAPRMAPMGTPRSSKTCKPPRKRSMFRGFRNRLGVGQLGHHRQDGLRRAEGVDEEGVELGRQLAAAAISDFESL